MRVQAEVIVARRERVAEAENVQRARGRGRSSHAEPDPRSLARTRIGSEGLRAVPGASSDVFLTTKPIRPLTKHQGSIRNPHLGLGGDAFLCPSRVSHKPDWRCNASRASVLLHRLAQRPVQGNFNFPVFRSLSGGLEGASQLGHLVALHSSTPPARLSWYVGRNAVGVSSRIHSDHDA